MLFQISLLVLAKLYRPFGVQLSALKYWKHRTLYVSAEKLTGGAASTEPEKIAITKIKLKIKTDELNCRVTSETSPSRGHRSSRRSDRAIDRWLAKAHQLLVSDRRGVGARRDLTNCIQRRRWGHDVYGRRSGSQRMISTTKIIVLHNPVGSAELDASRVDEVRGT